MITKPKFLNILYRRTVDIYKNRVRFLNRYFYKHFSYDLNNNRVDIETKDGTTNFDFIPNSTDYNTLFPDGNDYIIDEDPTRTFFLNNESNPAQDDEIFGTSTDYDEEGSQYIAFYSNSTNTVINGQTYSHPNHGRTFYLAKVDKNGDYVWVKDFNLKSTGGSISRINSVKCDQNGNVFIGGYFGGKIGNDTNNVTRTPVQAEAFLIRLDYDGNIKWIEDMFYNNGDPYTEVVATTLNDNFVYVTIYFGYSATEFKIGGKTIDLSELQGTSMTRSGMVIKLDYNGNYIAHKAFDTNGTVYLTNSYFNHGNLYVTGYLDGNGTFGDINVTNAGLSVIVIKMNKDLEPVMVIDAQVTGTSARYSDVVVDDNENIYVNGYFNGDISLDGSTNHDYSGPVGNFNSIAAKYDSSGNVVWSYPGSNLGYIIDIINDNIALINEYRGGATFEIDNKATSQTLVNPYGTSRINALVILDKNTGEYLDKFTYLFPIMLISGLTAEFDPDNNIYIAGYNVDTNIFPSVFIGADSKTYLLYNETSLTFGKICSKALDI